MLRDELIKNKINTKKLVLEKIKRLLMKFPDKEIILFGAGAGGENVYTFLYNNIIDGDKKIKCFVDNNPLKRNTTMCQKKVFSPQEIFNQYAGEIVIITCGEGEEIINQLISFSVSKDKIFIPDISVINENDSEFIWENIKNFEWFYNELKDEQSRNVLKGILNYKLSHDLNYIKKIYDNPKDQYFDKELIHFSPEDILLDCGAYIGDTVVEYINHNKEIYNKVICLEVDRDNCEYIRKLQNKFRIDLYDIAAYNYYSTDLRFDKIGSGSGKLIESGLKKEQEILITGDRIDSVLKDDKVSFIKMDIEGAEYKALLGAVETIEKYKPTLMISVYHKQDDMIKIPLLIKSINYNYKLYLRHYRSMSVQETVLYAIV